MRRINLSVALNVLALMLLGVFSYRLLLSFELSWDVLAYHLPFIAKRGGLPDSDTFVMTPAMYQRYLGYPSLIDQIRAFLWHLTGTPEGGSLIVPLSIVCFATYVCFSFRVTFIWSILIFVAVPSLHTALHSQYVDLWTNAFFSIFLLAAYESLGKTKHRILHASVAVGALAVAANSKPQFSVIGGGGLMCFGLVMLYEYYAARRDKEGKPGDIRNVMFLLALAAPLIFISPILNTVRFGNPLYPVAVSFGSFALNGTERPSNWVEGAGPTDLRELPQLLKWILSQMEYRALSMRPGGYSLGQGDVQAGSESDRMGGSLLVLLVTALCVLVLAMRRLPVRRAMILSIASLGALTTLAAMTPLSHELRYFSFSEIVLLVAALSILTELQGLNDFRAEGMLWALRSTLVGSALFVSFVTGFSHIYPSARNAASVIRALGIRDELTSALQKSKLLCYARSAPYGILYSKLFNPDIPQPYKVIAVHSASQCPDSSFVFR
jgi:hypothetical protein